MKTYYPKTDQCIHLLFEEQVKRIPDQVALICENQQLTYSELQHSVNQLARQLQALGVGTEVLTGIYMERSLEFVIGILAILKAGGAYVPLDPKYPKDRLSLILEDTKVSIILTQKKLKQELLHHPASIICIDTDAEVMIPESEEASLNQVTPQNLAYIMYTSGSTGKPKGVEMPHGSISNYIESINQILQVNDKDVYLHTASFSFSSSLRQLMLPLSQGAKIIIATQEQIKNPLSLFDLIQKQGVTVFDTVQSVWRYGIQALESLDDASKESLKKSQLRLLLFSGGLLPYELLNQVRSLINKRSRIVNIYGQTETVGVCAYPIADEFDQERIYVPIGHPYSYVKIYILDEYLQPVPVGEVGEMHIAGAGLARGYFNRPELTQEKFIPHPFSDEPGARLYKTGDLARYLPDGKIECRGRTDYQVKIRGIRIELGEIENTLLQHPAVEEAVVFTQTLDISGEPSLVAYIVLKAEQTLTNKKLRQFIKEQLPDYMVPATFVMLDALPLTPNGKIDRAALPAPDSIRQESDNSFVSPRDELEIKLTKIWEKVLGVQPIGIKDSFFELGGHSLIATRLFNEIEKSLGRKLLLATLFQAQTIEDLADLLRQEEEGTKWSSLVLIQPGGSKPPLFCIHPIGGNILEYYDLVRYLGREQPIYGLQSQGLDGIQEPLSRVEDMANNYIKDIRSIQPNGPYFLVGYSFGGQVAFEMAQQLYMQGQKVSFLALLDTISHKLEQVRLPFTEVIRIHLTNLWRLKLKQKWKYIRDRIDYKFKNVTYKDMLVRDLSKIETSNLQYLDVIDRNLQATQNYLPQVYPGVVTLFRCSVQPIETAIYPDLGWRDMVTGKLEIYEIPGAHYTLLKEPDVQVLAAKLKLCLNKLQVDND